MRDSTPSASPRREIYPNTPAAKIMKRLGIEPMSYQKMGEVKRQLQEGEITHEEVPLSYAAYKVFQPFSLRTRAAQTFKPWQYEDEAKAFTAELIHIECDKGRKDMDSVYIKKLAAAYAHERSLYSYQHPEAMAWAKETLELAFEISQELKERELRIN